MARKGEVRGYRQMWIYNEVVTVEDITPIGGWGLGKAKVEHLFSFYFCEVEMWIEKNKQYPLDLFIDLAAELPVYFFVSWDAAEKFAKTKSNRYPIERRLWWLRFQPEYWFATVMNYFYDTIRYLSDDERITYINSKVKPRADFG